MTFMPETISPLPRIAGQASILWMYGEGPNSFKLLPLANSDFRGFHSWVDTDVLVSDIMGPLSFHANWSGESEAARRLAPRERKSINPPFQSFPLKEKRNHQACAQKLQLTTIMTVTGPINVQMKWLSTRSQHLKRGDIRMINSSQCRTKVASHRSAGLAGWWAAAAEQRLLGRRRRKANLEGELARSHGRLHASSQQLLDSWLHSLKMSTNVGCRTTYFRLRTVNNILWMVGGWIALLSVFIAGKQKRNEDCSSKNNGVYLNLIN